MTKIHESWHETNINKMQLIIDAKKEVFHDLGMILIIDPNDEEQLHTSQGLLKALKDKHLNGGL